MFDSMSRLRGAGRWRYTVYFTTSDGGSSRRGCVSVRDTERLAESNIFSIQNRSRKRSSYSGKRNLAAQGCGGATRAARVSTLPLTLHGRVCGTGDCGAGRAGALREHTRPRQQELKQEQPEHRESRYNHTIHRYTNHDTRASMLSTSSPLCVRVAFCVDKNAMTTNCFVSGDAHHTSRSSGHSKAERDTHVYVYVCVSCHCEARVPQRAACPRRTQSPIRGWHPA
jgi:hypothetical protein